MNKVFMDNCYMRMAKIWSENSYARRLKVGCLIVKNNNIISDGYNGTPTGFDNNCEVEVDKNSKEFLFRVETKVLATKPEVLHAEANAITKLAKSTLSSEGSTLYVTHSPCLECAKLIIQAGIVRVVFHECYRNREGIDLLIKANILVEEI